MNPNQFKNNEVVKAARDACFKQDGAENKIEVQKYNKVENSGQHGNHPEYNKQVGNMLDNFKTENPNYAGQEALNFVRNMVSDIKEMISKNPDVTINDLFKPTETPNVVIPLKQK